MMNNETEVRLNSEERARCRRSISNERIELRKAKRAAENESQTAQIQDQLNTNENNLAALNLIALRDRDDNQEVLELIDQFEQSVSELADEVDAFRRATDKAQQIANVVAKADRGFRLFGQLISLKTE